MRRCWQVTSCCLRPASPTDCTPSSKQPPEEDTPSQMAQDLLRGHPDGVSPPSAPSSGRTTRGRAATDCSGFAASGTKLPQAVPWNASPAGKPLRTAPRAPDTRSSSLGLRGWARARAEPETQGNCRRFLLQQHPSALTASSQTHNQPKAGFSQRQNTLAFSSRQGRGSPARPC